MIDLSLLAFRTLTQVNLWDLSLLRIAVPAIVLFAMTIGFFQGVFLGLVLSVFVLVASFWRSGVVKFHATALEVRSRIERNLDQSLWLDKHGDLIQVVSE